MVVKNEQRFGKCCETSGANPKICDKIKQVCHQTFRVTALIEQVWNDHEIVTQMLVGSIFNTTTWWIL